MKSIFPKPILDLPEADVNLDGAKLYLVNGENEVKKLIVASSMSIYGEGAYKCEDCGIVYPKLRSEEQLNMQR